MVIRKTDEDVKKYKEARIKSEKGCEKCPCCKYKFKATDLAATTTRKTIIRNKMYQVTEYTCPKCEAEWDSEPYLW